MASELLKRNTLIQRLKEPNVAPIDFGLQSTGFEELFTLPETKPEELLNIQEENRKFRLLDSLNEIGDGLEDTSVDFINRENFANGTPDPVSGKLLSKEVYELIKKFGVEKYKKLNASQRSDVRKGSIGERFMTEEKKAERAKRLRPVFKGKGSKKGETPKVVDVSGPKELKEEYINDFKKRLQYPKAGREFRAAVEKGEVLSNPQLANKYGITVGEVERLNSFFIKQEDLKYQKGTPASGSDLRKRRLQLNQPGTYISGKGKIQFHHIMPIGGDVDLTSKDVAFINKYVNASLQKYNTPLNRIADGISNNLAKYSETKDTVFLKRVDDLNIQAAQIVDKTKKELPKKLQGLIGFNKITPVLDENATLINTTVERIGIDEAKTAVGKKGPKVKLSDMRSGTYTPLKFQKEAGEAAKKLTAFQELIKRQGSGIDPGLALKAGKEEFLDPLIKGGTKGLRAGATIGDFLISAGKGGTGLALGALLEADPIITGMTEGKDFSQTARDTFVGSAIDAIPGVNLGSLNEDLIKLADTEEQRVAVQNLIDYQKDYERFNKDLNAFKSYNQLNQVELEELGFTASDLVDMETGLAKRFKDIQTRAPKVYNPEVLSLTKEVARKEAEKRKENLEGIQGLIFGSRLAKDPDFIEKQINQIMAASTGAEGATDSYTDNYKFLPPPEILPEELDDIYEMGGIMGAAEGGRIGFADGPMNPKRRLFLKLMGGIASLPFVSKFIGKSEVAKPIVKIAGSSTTMPDWFPTLINKVMFSGTGKRIDADLTLYEPKELPGISIGRYDDGRVFVSGKNEYGKSYEIEYEPPGYELIDETTGKAVKRPGDFIAQEEVPVNVDPDGNADFDVEVLNDLDQILGPDTRAMEEFATGKKVKDMKRGEFEVGRAEVKAEQAADEAAELEMFDEID